MVGLPIYSSTAVTPHLIQSTWLGKSLIGQIEVIKKRHESFSSKRINEINNKTFPFPTEKKKTKKKKTFITETDPWWNWFHVHS